MKTPGRLEEMQDMVSSLGSLMFLKTKLFRKSAVFIAAGAAVLSGISSAFAAPTVVYQNSSIQIGYLTPGDSVNRAGYAQCAASIGDYIHLRAGNTTNIHPSMSIDVSSGTITIQKNQHVTNPRAAYICHNDTPSPNRILTGYVPSGTNIGAGLSCVLTIANFAKPRDGCSGCGGSVSCSYNASSGVITASQTGRGRISNCGYVCVDPATTADTIQNKFIVRSRQFKTTSGTDSIGVGRSVAYGTNGFSSVCSNTFIQGASYNTTSGVVTKGVSGGCGSSTYSYVTTLRESDLLSQCQNKIDDDGDGAIDFPADFSCSAPTDDDETNPKSQCQDGLDNDKDGLTDLTDPGCANKQDNNEGDGTSQCQDGIDNDADGAIDFPTDFSCSAKTDNDETNPKSQCQDGIDNDNDGAIDLADFSCQNNKQKNDEANPKSQCQDGLDNDKDGLSDLADPGCSDKQDNNEGDGTSQCQDGIDNDSDGATDFPGDFSCSAKTDNDETNPKSQCQDGIDNDNDGAIDLADFSCQNNKQKNDEANPKTICQDTLDNDSDGLVDLNDPGCSSGQDTDESDEVQKISLGTECVVDNVDGSYTAYFSYNNTTDGDISIPAASVGTQVNKVLPGDKNQGQPTLFLKGMQRGVASITYKAPSIEWSLRPTGGKKVSATASTSTPKCAPLEPIAKCRGYEGGKMMVNMSYRNNNPFALKFPIGDLNLFTPGQVDRGQPREFFTGLIEGAFKVEITSATDQSTWRLNGATSLVSNALKTCDGACIETATGTITGQLNQVAIDLADSANDAADLLAASPVRSSSRAATAKSSKKLSARRVSRTTAQDRRDAERARAAAQQYAKQSRELVLQFPAVIKNCPGAPTFCETVDRGATISQLRDLYAQSRNTIKRVVARAYFKATGSTRDVPSDPIYKQGLSLEAKGNAELNKLPRFATECK